VRTKNNYLKNSTRFCRSIHRGKLKIDVGTKNTKRHKNDSLRLFVLFVANELGR
jgi:hypothetical protein